MADEVEGVRAYLQDLVDHLDNYRDALFLEHVEPPAGYGVDVPKHDRPGAVQKKAE
jgi:hypothetical protein